MMGVALDTACSTGRFVRILADLDHGAVGVDGSADMLQLARGRVPEGDFHMGSVGQLPLADRSVEVAACAPTLNHASQLGPVFAEAIKGLGARIRSKTGIDADGSALIEKTMAGSAPMLRINLGQTRAERDEQLGVANLDKGLFSAFWNPVAHEPKLLWTMSKLDAFDVLGTLSTVHRRLDAAVRETGEGA